MFKNVWFVLSVNNFISTITSSRECVWWTIHTHLSSVIIKAPSYFHRAHYSSLCQADLFCKSYLGFMWYCQALTLHCSFGSSFTLLPAKWLLEIPFFLTHLSVILFSCPLAFAKHPWHLWSETILAHLLDCRWFYGFGCFCHKTLEPFLRLLEAKDGVTLQQQVWLSLGFAVSHVKDALWSHWRCAT